MGASAVATVACVLSAFDLCFNGSAHINSPTDIS